VTNTVEKINLSKFGHKVVLFFPIVMTQPYEISLLKIHAIGSVRADLTQTKTLLEYDRALFDRQLKNR
jgi:hypothetical protein